MMESAEGMRMRKAALRPIETNRQENKATHGEEKIHHSSVEETNEEEPLSPSARLFHEPNFNVHIIAILGGKTRINPDVVKLNLVHTLLKHPRFSSLLVRNWLQHFMCTYICM